MRGDNAKRKKARHSGKRQKPYPHETVAHSRILVGLGFRSSNDPDNDGDNDNPAAGGTADGPGGAE